MKHDVCQYLAAEVIINILSRLPIRSIIRFKCVCKSWVDLIESCEFAKSHLGNSKQIPGLAFSDDKCSKEFRFYKFADEHEHEHENNSWRHLSRDLILKFSLPTHLKHEHVFIRDTSSVNGLLLLCDARVRPVDHFICNPLTRTYIKLPPFSTREPHRGFGFGVSKMSEEFKMVGILRRKSEVYTLGTGTGTGTGTWRSINDDNKGFISYDHDTVGTFLNGKLHWVVREDGALAISCFDLDSEVFTTFSAPPPHVARRYHSSISVLEECLAFCHSTGESFEREAGFVVWMMNMNDDHDGKSWTRRFVITNASGDLGYKAVFPLKVFKDGDILIAQPCLPWLLCYFNKTNTITHLCLPFLYRFRTTHALIYTPTFLPLKTLVSPQTQINVISY